MTTSRLRLLLTGALVAFSLPPWGWWPLALVGCAAYARSAVSPRNNRPFRTAAWWSLGWFVPSFAWMWWLNVPGYVLVCVLFAAMHGTAGAVASVVGRESPAHHRLALVHGDRVTDAINAAERALELEPADEDVASLLEGLREREARVLPAA